MKTYNLKQTAGPSLGPLIAEVKDLVSIEQAADALELRVKLGLQLIGTSLQGDCPTGHDSANHRCFSIDTEDGLFNCFHCAEAGDAVDLVALVNHTGRFDATRWIAEHLAPELLPKFDQAMAAQSDEQKALHERGILYRLIFEEGHRQLMQPVAAPVLDYLMNERGYDLALIPQTEWIYWDTDANIRAYLEQQVPHMSAQIADLDLQGAFGDNFHLALPYRDRHGVIVGFLKRAHAKAGFAIKGTPDVRWDSTKGLKKADIFGLNRIRKEEELIVVEGYPDAAYLPVAGIRNVVAFGQAAFSEKYVEGLRVKGVKRLILALDNDGGTGEKNSEEICRLFAETDIRVFVIDPPAMGVHKDPDEYVKALGVDAFKALVAKAETASAWMSKRILSKYDLNADLGREKAIAEALEYGDSLDNSREAASVLDSLSGSLNLNDDLLAEEYKKLQERKATERLNEGIKDAARQAQRIIVEGEPEKAVTALQATMADLQTEYWRAKEPEQVKLDDFLAAKKNRDAERNAGDRIGFALQDFAEIDRELLGLQSGLYIIAADPNIGKTALMVSLMIDVLNSNADASCLFYSMDDSRDMIVNRLLAHLADMRINDVRFKMADDRQKQLLENAYQLLTRWFQEGRIDIREGSDFLTMSRINSEIRRHDNREKLVVFIDGLYNVPLETAHDSIRVENIERANQVKQLVRSFKVPVIATAEFRKQGREESAQAKKERTLHDIMETGKYGYNADLAILLSPKDVEAYREQDEPIIVADFSKNKLESFRGSMEFKFIRAKSVMMLVAGSKQNQ